MTRQIEIETHHSYGRLAIVVHSKRARSFVRGFCMSNPSADIEDEWVTDRQFIANDAGAGWRCIREAHAKGIAVEEESLGEAIEMEAA